MYVIFELQPVNIPLNPKVKPSEFQLKELSTFGNVENKFRYEGEANKYLSKYKKMHEGKKVVVLNIYEL